MNYLGRHKWQRRNVHLWLSVYLCWYIYWVSHDADKLINEVLDKLPTVDMSESSITCLTFKEGKEKKALKVWTANGFYAFASLATFERHFYENQEYSNKRPKRRTIYRLARYIRDNE